MFCVFLRAAPNKIRGAIANFISRAAQATNTLCPQALCSHSRSEPYSSFPRPLHKPEATAGSYFATFTCVPIRSFDYVPIAIPDAMSRRRPKNRQMRGRSSAAIARISRRRD
jgi:hypothetical protein